MLDLVARAWALDKGEPIAARFVILLRDDLDDVARAQLGPQRNHAAVHLCAHAGVAYFSVNRVSKVDRGSVGRNHNHLPLGREGINLVWIQVHLQAGEELVGVGHLLLPFDKLANPVQPLFIAGRHHAFAGLVLPVRCNTFLGDAVHLLGPDLHFELMATFTHHRGVQRLVAIGARNGDEVLDPPRYWVPQSMNESEDRITRRHVLGNHAHGQQIVDLVE